jgi:Protein of unknown function (DUF1488)
MLIEPEGWYMDAGPPSWDAVAKTFSFFLCKSGCDRVLCVLTIDALENAAQSSDLSEPAMNRIFDAHRLLIELRAAQKVNAGLFDSNGSVLSALTIFDLSAVQRWGYFAPSGRPWGSISALCCRSRLVSSGKRSEKNRWEPG